MWVEMRTRTYKCVRCKTECKSTSPNAKYCAKCRKEARRDSDNEQAKKKSLKRGQAH